MIAPCETGRSTKEEDAPALRVLIVDDDASTVRVIERILRQRGLAVDVAVDGESALQAIESHSYDVMILDLRMSNVGGLEVLRSIRARNDAPRTILHSAYLDVPTTVAAMRIGVADVVEKSVSLTLLTDRVFDLANQRRPARRTLPPPQQPIAEKGSDPAARLFGETDSVRAVREKIDRIS